MKRTTIAPAITRVHKLFRLRTIVNGLAERSKGGTTLHIGKILVDTNLSKRSILESGNKLKRARDHALNAAYLGLLIPIRSGTKFRYVVSPFGRLLHSYKFDEACPSDIAEASVFVDRMMRLKLTNPYDSRNTYSDFRTRPFVSVLTILRHKPLHVDQIHYLLGTKQDLATNPAVTKNLLKLFSNYGFENMGAFDRKFRLTNKRTRSEIGRSTRPLIDWCLQGGIITVDSECWCRITDKGLIALNLYSKSIPLWYDQFGLESKLVAAVLMIYSLANSMKKRVDYKSLDSDSKDALRLLQQKYGLFDKSFSGFRRNIDFDFYYDVPVKERVDVLKIIQDTLPTNLIKKPKRETVLKAIETGSLHQIMFLEEKLKQTSAEKQYVDLGKALGIEVPRREWFQTDFEWEACTRLRRLEFPVYPYKGEFEGVSKLPMATDNPDMIIKNNVKSLVECKSKAEWGEVLKFDKRVGGELSMYQLYTEDVNADSALFVCEAEQIDDDKFLSPFDEPRFNKIVIVTWKFLDECLHEISQRQRLEETIQKPTALSSDERVLIA